MTTQTVQQANLEVAVKPRQTAKTETAAPKEGDSFRSSMERAEQNAARAAKNRGWFRMVRLPAVSGTLWVKRLTVRAMAPRIPKSPRVIS